jgi:hypothetical protein
MSVVASSVAFVGLRGASALMELLPEAAVASARALEQAVDDLLGLRLSPLSAEQVRALAEFLEHAQSRVASARLAVVAGMDERDDIIPRCRPGESSVTFAQHVLGVTRAQARRDAHAAALLRPEVGDLPSTGTAYAAGQVTGGHVEVIVRAHRDLGHAAREAIVPIEELHDAVRSAAGLDGDNEDLALSEALAALAASTRSSEASFGVGVRQVLIVDVVPAHYARALGVPELDAVARRLVLTLNPPSPTRAHEQRYLTSPSSSTAPGSPGSPAARPKAH